MARIIDRISDAFGLLAAWIFFASGVILTYEVAARYLFNAPTVWVEEVSQLLLIAGVYLAVARTVHRRQNIRIDAFYNRLGPAAVKIADTFALLCILVFAGTIVWYGAEIAGDSLMVGRTTGSIINIPSWWSQGLIPLGFGLVVFQVVVELVRVWTGSRWGGDDVDEDGESAPLQGGH